MTVVCGTDFSPGAEPAIRAAAAIARRLGDELWLVHALGRSATALGDDTRRTVEAAAEQRLRTDAARMADGVTCRVALTAGPAYAALPELAAEKKARLLVVSSRGHGSLPVYRLGGTSERLAQVSRVPLLVVRDSAPLEAWGRAEKPLRVLLGFDWTASSEAALHWVKSLRMGAPCDVTVGYVYASDMMGEAERRYGLPQRHPFWQPDAELERLLARDLSERVGNLGGAGEVVFRPKLGVGRTADHLLELADTERAELIVVGTHRKRGLARLTSVAGIALHMSHASVLCVPAAENEILASQDVPVVDCVLVPTDLSAESNAAALHGYGLLTQPGGELMLAHIVPPGDQSDESAVIAALRGLLSSRPALRNVRIRTAVVRHSHPAAAICELAERIGADVICMTSHGRGGRFRAVLGSVAEGVLRKTRRPVLVVRSPRP